MSGIVSASPPQLAAKLEAMAAAKGVELILPTDVLAADAFAADAKTVTVSVDAIPSDHLGVDNGPVTTQLIQQRLAACKTVIWNGPMVRATLLAASPSARLSCAALHCPHARIV